MKIAQLGGQTVMPKLKLSQARYSMGKEKRNEEISEQEVAWDRRSHLERTVQKERTV